MTCNGFYLVHTPRLHVICKVGVTMQVWGSMGGTTPLGNGFKMSGPSRHLSASHAA